MKGSLQKYIDSAKKKFCIPNDIIISGNIVRQRVKRKTKCGHIFHKSPMEDVEPYLVELIKKLASMQTLVTTAQGLELANSLIEGKSSEKKELNGNPKTAMQIS